MFHNDDINKTQIVTRGFVRGGGMQANCPARLTWMRLLYAMVLLPIPASKDAKMLSLRV